MACKIIRPENREEWLRLRGYGIGSSEVATILGVNKWETPLQLWRRKKGIDPPKEENFAMKAGHYLEDAVSMFFADATEAKIIKNSAGDWLMVDEERPYLRVSPDRLFWDGDAKHNESQKGILECKTTQMDVDPDAIPPYWFCQLQYQLYVSGYKHGALAWLVSGRNFGYKRYGYDKDFCEWMVSEVDKFWNENIVNNVEPAPVNADDILLKSPRHILGKTVDATADIMQCLTNLKMLKEDIKANEREAKSLEDNLKMFMGDAEAILCNGNTVATWKASADSEKFDSKTFKAENPEMYNQYLRTSAGVRRLILK